MHHSSRLATICMLLAFTFTVVAGEESICDLNHSIIYCRCDYDNTEVLCYSTNTTQATPIHPVWDLFRGMPIQKLKFSAFHSQTLNFIPKRSIDYLSDTLTSLTLSDLDLTTLETGTFSNLKALETLEISISKRMVVKENAFFSLPKLEKVTLNEINLANLCDMFENVPALLELYLENNEIQEIDDGAFSSLNSLSFLALERNLIKHVNRKTFVGLRKLKSLEMSHNKLNFLQPYTFTEMPELQKIDLSHNEIRLIDTDAFDGLKFIGEINLSHNRLHQLPGSVFSSNTELDVVELGFNNFEHLSRQVFYNTAKKRFIRIKFQGNSLKCDCSLFWLRTALSNFDSIIVKQMESIDCQYAPGKKIPERIESIMTYILSNETNKECNPNWLPPPPPPPPTKIEEVVEEKEEIVHDDDDETVPIETISELDIPHPVEEAEDDHKEESDHHSNEPSEVVYPPVEDTDEEIQQKKAQLNTAGVGGGDDNDNDNGNHCSALKSNPYSLLLAILLPFILLTRYLQ